MPTRFSFHFICIYIYYWCIYIELSFDNVYILLYVYIAPCDSFALSRFCACVSSVNAKLLPFFAVPRASSDPNTCDYIHIIATCSAAAWWHGIFNKSNFFFFFFFFRLNSGNVGYMYICVYGKLTDRLPNTYMYIYVYYKYR